MPLKGYCITHDEQYESFYCSSGQCIWSSLVVTLKVGDSEKYTSIDLLPFDRS